MMLQMPTRCQARVCGLVPFQVRTTLIQSTPYNHHHHSSFFLKKNMVFRKNGLQGHGALVFDFKICPFWVDEGGQSRSMQGGTKADNSFPVNIQKDALCFRIIWQGSLIDVYAINHNTTTIIHDTGIQIRNAKSEF